MFVTQKAYVFHHERSQKISLFSLLKFFGLCPLLPKKKLSLSQKQESVVLLPPIVSSLSLFQRINQISLHLLSRNSIALFYKGVFIYQNTVISVILLSSRHRREREREQKAQILSLLKKEIED